MVLFSLIQLQHFLNVDFLVAVSFAHHTNVTIMIQNVVLDVHFKNSVERQYHKLFNIFKRVSYLFFESEF